jgi:adenosylhomocysteine nucleosidase
MEGASIAQVCFLNKIPFLVFRSISDTPNGNNNIDFNEYLKLASKNCATFILELIKTLEG